MAKFCGKCGRRLDETTGLCPNCVADKIENGSAQEKLNKTSEQRQEVVQVPEESLSKKDIKKKRKADKKTDKKAKKKEKWTKLTTGQKVRRFFLKSFLWLILFAVISVGVIGGLSYIEMLNIPLWSDYNRRNILETLNERAVVVEEMNIVMETDNEGTASIVVQIPDYELLFKEAYASENPDQYLLKALALRKYEIQEYEEAATVTVEEGETVVHSDDVAQRLLEEALINAINALSEVE